MRLGMLLFLCVLQVLSGCATTTQPEPIVIPTRPAPAPVVESPVPTAPAAMAPAPVEEQLDMGAAPQPVDTIVKPVTSGNEHQVEVFFATSRARANASRPVAFTSERAPLSYGAVRVSVPPKHVRGRLERPRWYLLELKPNPKKHFLIQSITPLSQGAFYNRVAPVVAGGSGTSFVFVHGYNVSFEDAALRTAQLSVDLDLAAAPIFYSWPSSGSMLEYLADSQAAQWAEPHLKKFLEDFATRSGSTSVVVIAHSMGSRPVAGAIAALLKERPNLRPVFKEIILAAPDIDEDIFFEQLLPAYVETGKVITLYASSNDKALIFSKRANKKRRIGDSSPSPFVATGLETIDASNLNTDFLGHGYLAAARPLIEDITVLIKNGARPQKRALSKIDTPRGPYWRFAR